MIDRSGIGSRTLWVVPAEEPGRLRESIDDREQSHILQSALAAKGDTNIRIFLISCIAAAVIAVSAAVTLFEFQEPAAVAFSTSAVRI